MSDDILETDGTDDGTQGDGLTVTDAARMLGISENALRVRLSRGVVKTPQYSARKVGRHWYVTVHADAPRYGQATEAEPAGDRMVNAMATIAENIVAPMLAPIVAELAEVRAMVALQVDMRVAAEREAEREKGRADRAEQDRQKAEERASAAEQRIAAAEARAQEAEMMVGALKVAASQGGTKPTGGESSSSPEPVTSGGKRTGLLSRLPWGR